MSIKSQYLGDRIDTNTFQKMIGFSIELPMERPMDEKMLHGEEEGRKNLAMAILEAMEKAYAERM